METSARDYVTGVSRKPEHKTLAVHLLQLNPGIMFLIIHFFRSIYCGFDFLSSLKIALSYSRQRLTIQAIAEPPFLCPFQKTGFRVTRFTQIYADDRKGADCRGLI